MYPPDKNWYYKFGNNRSATSEKEWVDAYNVQIGRLLKVTKLDQLTNIEKDILFMLIERYIESSICYMYKKYCIKL